MDAAVRAASGREIDVSFPVNLGQLAKVDAGLHADVERIALTMDQVEEYGPPPNFAKEKGSRFEAYVDEHGTTDSWELDALSPQTLEDLVQEPVDEVLDLDQWNKSLELEAEEREQLRKHAELFKARK
jgi:hypothetical protein